MSALLVAGLTSLLSPGRYVMATGITVIMLIPILIPILIPVTMFMVL